MLAVDNELELESHCCAHAVMRAARGMGMGWVVVRCSLLPEAFVVQEHACCSGLSR